MAYELSRIDRKTRTYELSATVLAEAAAVPPDLTGVDVALLPPRGAPTASTVWFSADYDDGSFTVLLAGPDADSTGALVVPASADIWMRIADAPEVDAEKLERLIVLGGGGVIAAPTGVPVITVNGHQGGTITLDADDVGAQSSATLGADVVGNAAVKAAFMPAVILNGTGIDPTGVSDSTAAIQAKLDALRIAGGGTAFLPPGIHKVSDSIRLGSDTRLVGAGWSSILRLAPNTNVTQSSNKHVVTNHDQTNGNTGIQIESLWVDGNGDQNVGGHYCGIFLNKVTHSHVDRVKVTDPLRHNNVEDTYGECIQIRNSSYVKVTNCLADESGVLNAKDGIKLTYSSHCVVANNTCINCNAAGVQLAYDVHDCTVTGNVITSDGTIPAYDRRSGIRIHRGIRNVVTGNSAYNVQVGLDLLEAADFNELTGNYVAIFTDSQSACILLRDQVSTACTGNVIQDNVFTGTTGTSNGPLVSLNRAVSNFIRRNHFHTGPWSTRTVTLDANSTTNVIEDNEFRALSQLTITNLGTGNTVDPVRASRNVGAKLKRTSNQTVATATLTVVDFNGEDWDTDTFHDNTTNPGRLIIPAGLGGKYEIAAGAGLANNGTENRASFYLRVNGTTVARDNHQSATPADRSGLVSTTVQLAAGDYVEFSVYHEAGGPLDLDVTQYGTSAAWMTAQRIAA